MHLVSLFCVQFPKKNTTVGLMLQEVKDTPVIDLSMFWYVKPGSSLQRFHEREPFPWLSIGYASTNAFSCWKIKKLFNLFGSMMDCFKLLCKQSRQKKSFGFGWPAKYFNGSIARDNSCY